VSLVRRKAVRAAPADDPGALGETLESVATDGSGFVIDERFRVVGRLGAGAMGVVYHAEDVLLLAHVSNTPSSVSAHRPEFAALDGVFARALAKDLRYRHATCAAFAAELVDAARRAGLLTGIRPSAPPAPPPLAPRMRRRSSGTRRRVRAREGGGRRPG
jgi:hypothetical protein